MKACTRRRNVLARKANVIKEDCVYVWFHLDSSESRAWGKALVQVVDVGDELAK